MRKECYRVLVGLILLVLLLAPAACISEGTTSSAPSTTSSSTSISQTVTTTAITSTTQTTSSTTSQMTTQKPIELSLNVPPPNTQARWVEVMKPWVDELEARAGGRLKIVPYFGGSLAKDEYNFDAVATGLADIGTSFTDSTPGKFPLSEMFLVPAAWGSSSKSNSIALWKGYEKTPELQKEWSSVKLLELHVGPPQRLNVAPLSVKTVADFKGLKIVINSGKQADAGKILGFTPTQMATADLYLGLEKKVIDGVIGGYEFVLARKFYDFTKYNTTFAFGASTFYTVMNTNKYNSLPADIKKIIDDMSGYTMAERFGKGRESVDSSAKEKCIAAGLQINELSKEETAKWRELLSPIMKYYIAELEAKGLAGQKVYDAIKAELPAN
jgi:TRAP-type C4-dicarboxylate transport system substrate-binding protein